MNLDLIHETPSKAQEKLAAYRRRLGRRSGEEFKAIERAYEQVAKGKKLIRLSRAFSLGGWDDRGRPNLAIARADTQRVECSINNGQINFDRVRQWRQRFSTAYKTSILLTSFSQQRPNTNWWSGTAIVPIVPPDIMPKSVDLSKRWILFEADWQDAPVDPALLLHIGGDLYAVEAVWDLTPIEQAVLSGRRLR